MSDSVPYTDDEAREARMWSNKHGPSNAWTAGNGTAARMIGRLLDERERLMATVTAMRSESDYMRSWKEAMNFWEGIVKDHEADRDMFAAAAMTGLLASDPGLSAPDIRRMSFNWADAMLRERANYPEKPNSSTNHDAAPAAKAEPESVGTDKAEPLMGQGTGDMHEPVAWEVRTSDGAQAVYLEKADAYFFQKHPSAVVSPLYRHQDKPKFITCFERNFLQNLRDAYEELAGQEGCISITRKESHEHYELLRGLLERLA